MTERTEVNVAGRLALIEYYEVRIKEEQEHLDYMTANASWFRLRQTTQSGEVDITEQARDGVRRAIEDYRKAIEHLNTWE